jgi:signal transduction histidine kinase
MAEIATVSRRSGVPRHQRQAPSTLWRNYLAAGAVVALAYLLIPASRGSPPLLGLKVALCVGVSASAVVAMVVGLRRLRPADPAPWRALIAAQVVFLAGDVVFYAQHLLLHSGEYPSVGDLLHLASYPPLVLGVLLLVRARTRGRDPESALDALIIATGFGVLSLVVLIEPSASAVELPLGARLVSAAYPVMDLLVLAAAARLVVGAGPRQTALYLFTASLAALLASDSAYAYAQANGAYRIDSPLGRAIDAGWLAFHLLLGATALHPSMRGLAERDLRTRSRMRLGRLLILAGAVVLAPAAIVLQDLGGRNDDTALVGVVCGLLFLAVLYRMSIVVRELESSATQLREHGSMLQATLGELEKVEGDRKHLLDRTMEGAEEERTRIAAELHDGPIQRLTALGYQLEQAALTLRRGDEPRARLLLGTAQRGLRSEVDQLRGLMTTLRPPVLDERGLALALADELDSFERRTGVVCTLQSRHDARLDPEIETVLYRVVQEALSNVAKHARAEHVWVDLRTEDDRVDMRVRDDGVGFESNGFDRMVDNGHFGLAGMRHRVEMAAGSYQLESAPGSGTAILVQVPRRRVTA